MLTLAQDTMLGNIPTDWRVESLKALLISNAPGDWGEDRGPHMVNVLRSTNLTSSGNLDLSDVALRALDPKKAALLTLLENDLLLERSGGGPDQPVGRVAFVDHDMPEYAFSNFLHLLRPNQNEVHPRYLARVLYQINQTGRILRLEQQTTQMRNLNFRDYLTMPLPLPSPEEQRVIVLVLDAVGNTIEQAQTARSRSEDLKRALAQKLFAEGTRKEARKKTRIGLIPRSWEVRCVSDVVTDFEYGLSLAMSPKGATPILRMGNIQQGDVIMEDLKYVTISPKLLARYRLKRGDVLFNRTNSQVHVGKIGIYRSAESAVFASYLIRLHGDPKLVDNYFLGHLLNSYLIQCRIKRYATPGVQQVNINAKNLGKVLIPVPSGKAGLEEQQEIAAILEEADQQVRCLAAVIKELEQLQRSLLHDLLAGAVRMDSSLFQKGERA